MTTRLAFCLGPWLGVLAVGCGDDGGGADAGTSAATGSETGGDSGGTGMIMPMMVDYATQVQPIWNSCTCHLQGPSGTMTAPFLTLNEGMSIAQTVGVPSMQLPTMDRVTPGDLEQSYLWHKVEGTNAEQGGVGTQMPPGGMLSAEDRIVVRDWILTGANP